jgi:hypothetical protein
MPRKRLIEVAQMTGRLIAHELSCTAATFKLNKI